MGAHRTDWRHNGAKYPNKPAIPHTHAPRPRPPSPSTESTPRPFPREPISVCAPTQPGGEIREDFQYHGRPAEMPHCPRCSPHWHYLRVPTRGTPAARAPHHSPSILIPEAWACRGSWANCPSHCADTAASIALHASDTYSRLCCDSAVPMTSRSVHVQHPALTERCSWLRKSSTETSVGRQL